MDAGFHALDAGDVVKHFRNAPTRRLILLDYGGTIYADQAADDNIQHYSVATGARTRVRARELQMHICLLTSRKNCPEMFV